MEKEFSAQEAKEIADSASLKAILKAVKSAAYDGKHHFDLVEEFESDGIDYFYSPHRKFNYTLEDLKELEKLGYKITAFELKWGIFKKKSKTFARVIW